MYGHRQAVAPARTVRPRVLSLLTRSTAFICIFEFAPGEYRPGFAHSLRSKPDDVSVRKRGYWTGPV